MSGIANPYTPLIQTNMSATRAPLVTDDTSQGYSPGSSWQNTTLGVRWTCRDASVGAAIWTRADNADFYGYVSGRWYIPFGIATTLAGTTVPLGTMRLFPWLNKERFTLAALGIRITTVSSGGNAGIALYAADPASRFSTGAPITSVGGLSTAGATAVSAAIANTVVEPGLYWFATQFDNATVQTTSLVQSGTFAEQIIGSATEANASLASVCVNYSYTGQTYGAWPDLTSTTPVETPTSSAMTPVVHFKVA